MNVYRLLELVDKKDFSLTLEKKFKNSNYFFTQILFFDNIAQDQHDHYFFTTCKIKVFKVMKGVHLNDRENCCPTHCIKIKLSPMWEGFDSLYNCDKQPLCSE